MLQRVRVSSQDVSMSVLQQQFINPLSAAALSPPRTEAKASEISTNRAVAKMSASYTLTRGKCF